MDKRLSIGVRPFQKFFSHGVRHRQLRQSENHPIEVVGFLKVLERISVIVTPIVQLPGLISRKQLEKIGGVLAVLNHFEIPGVAQLGFYLYTRQLKINPLIDLNP